MQPFVLYCKSYHVDVKRVVRLADTIARFNVDHIPFYVSAPAKDLPLFKQMLGTRDVQLIADEDIIAANPALQQEDLQKLPGNVSQQIIKSEFWRLGVSQAYLCLDSDCMFIRPFTRAEFVTENATPYTIIDEGRDLMFAALSKKGNQILTNFQRESGDVQSVFGRKGKHYNFGPNCPVWDCRVWKSLDDNLLQPNSQSLLDLILTSPNEMRWYGEALLKYKAVELLPSQPFFKMYHYAWQQRKDQRQGIRVEDLTQLYCGVVFQSAWERELDWPSEGGNWLSRMARRARRRLGRM